MGFFLGENEETFNFLPTIKIKLKFFCEKGYIYFFRHNIFELVPITMAFEIWASDLSGKRGITQRGHGCAMTNWVLVSQN